jgi:hypothetical protein
MACIKDLILRNIQAIESNFLMMDEEDEISLNLINNKNIEEGLEVGLKRRIEQEIIKRDYYMERITRFKDWTETVLINIDSIMRTMGRDVFPESIGLGKRIDSERFAQPMTDSKRLAQHVRAESFNLGDSMSGGDVFGYRPQGKKRSSEMYSYDRNQMNAFGNNSNQYKSSQGHESNVTAQLRRGYSKGSQRNKRHLKGDSFEL